MKKTEEELLLLISHLEAVIDNLPFDVWLKDADGNYLIVNKSIVDDTGRSKEELIGKNDYDIYPKDSADVYVTSDRATIEGENLGYYELKVGNDIYEEYKRPAFDELGKIIGTTGFSRNITESKKINDALIESERSKAVLLSNLPGVAYRSSNDSNFTMTFISKGCYDLTGYTGEELLSRKPSYYDLIHPQYLSPLFEKWKADVALNLISTDEYPIITASGETKWVWEQSQEVYDSEQNLIATEGLIIDVTERKLAEEALKQSEERFRTIFEEAPLGMGIFNSKNGNVYQVNTRFTEIIGRTKEEVLSLNWKHYTHTDDVEEIQHKMELLNAYKLSNFSMNSRLIKPDCSAIWVNMTIASFKLENHSNPRHLCMIEDITERKQAEEEILYLSYYDQLTGLYNRRFYEEELKRLDTKRNLPMTLVMGDVNGLKLINDSLGHAMGDELLKKAAEVIKNGCRADDIIARIGGDEFVVLLPKTDAFETEKIINRINERSSKEKVGSVSVSISFGYKTKNNEEENIEEIFKQAEDKMYKRKLTKSKSTNGTTMSAIITMLYKKNKREEQHCHRVSQLCESMAVTLKLPEYEIMKLKMVALLHDIGKVVIDENILNKPGKLTDSEWVEIKRHSEIGYRILSTANDMSDMAGCVLAHHERWDGKGYPNGLKEEEIPFMSRIIAIVDAYDAMTSERSYRSALPEEVAVEELQNNAGTQFDPILVSEFIEKVLGKSEYK